MYRMEGVARPDDHGKFEVQGSQTADVRTLAGCSGILN